MTAGWCRRHQACRAGSYHHRIVALWHNPAPPDSSMRNYESVFCGALTGHTFTQMPHSVQILLSTITTSLIMLMAITGHRSMHPPQPVHLAVSIVTIHLLLWMLFFKQVVEKLVFSQAGQKHPYARRAKSRGMRRTLQYVAMTKDERNAADGCFSTAC
jgi:hypothetical protein